MNRDLVFFVSGLTFGVVAGYFLFHAVSPAVELSDQVASRPPEMSSSSIGLEQEPEFEALDEEKRAELEARAGENARDPAVRAELGSLFLNAGRFTEAVPWLEESLALAPNDLHVRNHLAVAYLNVGRLPDAVEVYEKTLASVPGDPASLLGLGRIKLYLQKDIRAGLKLWERLVEVAPESAEARSVREELEALQSAHAGS
ncbi:MAG TPA: tetratricopeptide repeat protein [Vicinamibacteria bacterium]|nr:tetratricopeptide repeat protein [Vicinamibacteria bacterium]